eukprot:TRINITY_DN4847_c0_g1_i1.p2 TRINITY_DN4847_c0_g1~~TRINITY_DN4847_c0_g1_i1.p2  ORF type:complete len:92 (-),score=13.01 TRINITY_DN4847_c0_g1_i1:195-470(-)
MGGAESLCEYLGYDNGVLRNEPAEYLNFFRYDVDSLLIGKCMDGEPLGDCKGLCNEYTIGEKCAEDHNIQIGDNYGYYVLMEGSGKCHDTG